MAVVFYSRVLGQQEQRPHAVARGRAELVDGEVVISPPPFDAWLRSELRQHKRWQLDPRDGAAFLRKLPKVFNGAYFYAVTE